MIFEYKSKIGKADSKGVSARTIIPAPIVKIMDLNFGDNIVWTANVTDKGATITITKKEEKQA